MERKEIVGKWADYAKAVQYIIENRDKVILMDVEVIDGQKFYVLYTENNN